MMDAVSKSEYNSSLVGLWASYQADLVASLSAATKPHPERKLRILIAMPVTVSMLETLALNLKKLQQNQAGDEFKLALFYYESPEGKRPEMPIKIAQVLDPHLDYERAGPGCKAKHWRGLGADLVRKYDYVWLMDGDLQMDYFSWDLYRHILLELDPVVSQPSILGWAPGKRATDLKILAMKRMRHDGEFPLALETHIIEQQAPLISTKLWPAMYKRLTSIEGKSSWSVEGWWDRTAIVMKQMGCLKTYPMLINASPLRHANCHDLNVKDNPAHCERGWKTHDCFKVTSEEAHALDKAFAFETHGHCKVGAEVWKKAHVCGRHDHSKDMGLRQWGAKRWPKAL